MRRPFALLLLSALLVSTGCDALFDSVDDSIREAGAEVKKEKGLDITDPMQVAAAGFIADEKERKQLEEAKSVQRLVNESRGDARLDNGDTAGARESYERALSWTNSGDKRNSVAIKEKIATTWLEQAVRFGDDETMRGLRTATRTFASLAATAPNPKDKSRLLTKQALAERDLDRNTIVHCRLARQALELDPDNEIARHRIAESTDCRRTS